MVGRKTKKYWSKRRRAPGVMWFMSPSRSGKHTGMTVSLVLKTTRCPKAWKQLPQAPGLQVVHALVMRHNAFCFSNQGLFISQHKPISLPAWTLQAALIDQFQRQDRVCLGAARHYITTIFTKHPPHGGAWISIGRPSRPCCFTAFEPMVRRHCRSFYTQALRVTTNLLFKEFSDHFIPSDGSLGMSQ